MSSSAPWLTLFFLGAYHGINPGMGWLFAVALGMQENSARAVVRSLAPIALGHAISIGVVVLAAGLLQIVLPRQYIKFTVAAALLALGLYKIVRHRHFRWSGMRVGFRDLTLWSFLMASAHGAGLMLLPIVLALNPEATHAMHHMQVTSFQGPLTGIEATVIHTLGYLTLTAVLALVVYRKVGLALLRKSWFNLDLIWAIALIATGCFALTV
ncbi:MAG: hypothetical protein JOY54_10705 [Acidobacteriaceae bacterium]|nr:hypothetical protein [Acidobacteriaceae bacterium]